MKRKVKFPFGKVVYLQSVSLNRNMEKLTQAENEFRELFLEYVRKGEDNSELPIKQFRINSPTLEGAVDHITFEARTYLGAMFMFMDFVCEIYKDFFWSHCAEDFNETPDEVRNIEAFCIDFEQRLHSFEYDDYLFEISEPVTISFHASSVKSASKA